MKIVRWILSFFAWLQILASPLLIGLAIGFFVYKNYPTKTGLILSVCISLISLLIGITIATKIWKKKGTVNFISNVSASPDFDNLTREGKEIVTNSSISDSERSETPNAIHHKQAEGMAPGNG